MEQLQYLTRFLVIQRRKQISALKLISIRKISPHKCWSGNIGPFQGFIMLHRFLKPSHARFEKASQNRYGKIIFFCFPFPFFYPPYHTLFYILLSFFFLFSFFLSFSPLFLPFPSFSSLLSSPVEMFPICFEIMITEL